jgi:hypothetical protein
MDSLFTKYKKKLSKKCNENNVIYLKHLSKTPKQKDLNDKSIVKRNNLYQQISDECISSASRLYLISNHLWKPCYRNTQLKIRKLCFKKM